MTSLAIAVAITGSSTEKLYQELRLESLQNRRWFRKHCFFCKTVKDQSQKYLFDLIPSNNNSYQTRNSQNLVIPHFKVKNSFFPYSFFPLALVEWNKLGSNICNSPLYSTFKKKILNFVRPRSNNFFNVSHPKGLIYLRFGLSHLRKHKFHTAF